jgi:hypothetical protein
MMHEHESCGCGVCKHHPFERNNYFPGKALAAPDFAAEQAYFNHKRQLINRAVIGWGIVCGLEVGADDCGLAIEPGFALDCCGRELLVCECERVTATTVVESLGVDPCGAADPIRWALCLEYRECRTQQVAPPPSCDQGERGRQYNRIRDDFKMTFRRWSDACPDDHDAPCCAHKKLGTKTSLHRALTERARKCPACKDCECVILAVGTLITRPGSPPRLALDEDGWKYRRLIYTNPALAGFIRCFHGSLAHITEISWMRDEFTVGGLLDTLRKEPLRVTFDRPMDESSVKNRRSCRLTIYVAAADDNGCVTPLLIPVKRIEYGGQAAEYYFDEDCVEDHLRRRCKSLKKPADLELILHGAMIHDQNGRALDAELIDGYPTGNGVEAGEFIKYFLVIP